MLEADTFSQAHKEAYCPGVLHRDSLVSKGYTPLPVIRVVFALASDTPGDFLYIPGQTSWTRITADDIWFARDCHRTLSRASIAICPHTRVLLQSFLHPRLVENKFGGSLIDFPERSFFQA